MNKQFIYFLNISLVCCLRDWCVVYRYVSISCNRVSWNRTLFGFCRYRKWWREWWRIKYKWYSIGNTEIQSESDSSKPKVIELYNLTEDVMHSLDEKCAIYSSSRRRNPGLLYESYKNTIERFDFLKCLAKARVSPWMNLMLQKTRHSRKPHRKEFLRYQQWNHAAQIKRSILKLGVHFTIVIQGWKKRHYIRRICCALCNVQSLDCSILRL